MEYIFLIWSENTLYANLSMTELITFYSLNRGPSCLTHFIRFTWQGFGSGGAAGFVLVLAGIELIFFLVAGMGLCFGFVLRTVLITQGCVRCC